VLTPTGETGVVNGVALAFRNDLPVRLSFENAMQEQTVIEFFDVTDQVGSSDPFKFDVPEFVDVIDDRRQD
jgi:outer membrane lipoprotein-sorting protein